MLKRGNMRCPVCKGKGKITENTREYEFITRDPVTSDCLVCGGTGQVGPRKKLPDGRGVHELVSGNPAKSFQRKGHIAPDEGATRLNVSVKAVINPEVVDTGVGYNPEPQRSQREEEGAPARGKEHHAGQRPAFLEMALNPRLNKVLASGKEFLIVTETEPYYMDVYRMIRAQEKKQGTWTEGDEEAYVEALIVEREKLITELTKYKRQDVASTNKRQDVASTEEVING